MNQEHYNTLHKQKNLKSSLFMRIFALVFLFAIQLFSSQVFVKDNTTLYLDGDNYIISDSISRKRDKEKTPKSIIYISSGSQILIMGNQNLYNIVKIDGELNYPKEKDKRLAKISPQKKTKSLRKSYKS